MAGRFLVLLNALVLTTGCSLPRDADGTLNRVRHGTLRVGLISNPPWVVDGDAPQGIEPNLADAVARPLGARIEWIRKPAVELFPALHDRQIDLLIGGLTDDFPWSQEIALTRPYYVDTITEGSVQKTYRHVLAVAPGENAWQAHVERVLQGASASVPSQLSTSRSPMDGR